MFRREVFEAVGGYRDACAFWKDLILFEVEELSPEAYSERKADHIRFTDRRGPLTLNLRGNRIVFDWYHDRFSPLAGFQEARGTRDTSTAYANRDRVGQRHIPELERASVLQSSD